MVPHLRVELRTFFLLREATLPICPVGQNWMRGKDSNLRPLGYEPSSLATDVPRGNIYGATERIRTSPVGIMSSRHYRYATVARFLLFLNVGVCE